MVWWGGMEIPDININDPYGLNTGGTTTGGGTTGGGTTGGGTEEITTPPTTTEFDPSQWGDVPLGYIPDLSWINPSYRPQLENMQTVQEGPYSGMYIAPTQWLIPGYGFENQVIPYETGEATDTSALNFPTAEEATAWASSLYPFQMAGNMLGMASTPEGFMQSPYMQQAMQAIGRSNLPSSSYADKVISNAVMQNALNTAGAWGNYMGAVAPWASGYAQYPLTVAGLLQG